MEEFEKIEERMKEKSNAMDMMLDMFAEVTGDKVFVIQKRKKTLLDKLNEVVLLDLKEEEKEKIINTLEQFIQITDDLAKEIEGEKNESL